MKKIGILTCIHSNDVCTRAGCMRAFNCRTDFFASYPKDTALSVMMTCNGCAKERSEPPEKDDGMLEKIDRLVQENIEVIHVGVCRLKDDGQECERITKICDMISSNGIEIVRGTHKE